jgi:hypothetical protein
MLDKITISVLFLVSIFGGASLIGHAQGFIHTQAYYDGANAAATAYHSNHPFDDTPPNGSDEGYADQYKQGYDDQEDCCLGNCDQTGLSCRSDEGGS